MRAAWLSLVVSVCVAVPGAYAWDKPQVDYSAHMAMESADGVFEGDVMYSPGKERREMLSEREKLIMIFRHDKNVIWTLMPDAEMYMEQPIPKEGRGDDLSAWQIETTDMDPETVNDVECSKQKVIMTGPKDKKMGGFWWLSDDHIVVKLDAITVEGKTKDRFKIDLTNLKVEQQDPALFEIPEGYMPMSFGNMMGGDDGAQGVGLDDLKGFLR